MLQCEYEWRWMNVGMKGCKKKNFKHKRFNMLDILIDIVAGFCGKREII